MIKLKDILSEVETDPNKVFGDIAFGDDPRFQRIQGKRNYEENTKYEDIIFDIISDWAHMADGITSKKLYRREDLFRAASKKFPTVFKPDTPNGTEVYRGLATTKTKLISFLKKTPLKDWKSIEINNKSYKRYKKPIEYNPSREVQSWTTSQSIAHRFAESSVLISKQNEEYLFSQKTMNIIFNGRNEKEILHFGKQFSNDVFIAIPIDRFKKIFSGIQ
jgi:hypothetical protein